MIRLIREWSFRRKHMKACRQLQADVNRRRNSPDTVDYRKRRAAALKAHRA